MTIVDNQPATQRLEPARLATARKAMIESQLRVNGVNSEIVRERMGQVPREDFIPETARGFAYMDRAIPLGEGRFLAAPLVQGRMLEEAAPAAADRVLLVDGGSGYLAELLRPIVGALEVLSCAEALEPSRKKGDFTLLLIDGAVEHIPDQLIRRLADDGRVVGGIVSRGITRLAIGRKAGGQVALLPLAEIGIPILPEFAAPKNWSF